MMRAALSNLHNHRAAPGLDPRATPNSALVAGGPRVKPEDSAGFCTIIEATKLISGAIA